LRKSWEASEETEGRAEGGKELDKSGVKGPPG